jgi:alpha-L-fucosidase
MVNKKLKKTKSAHVKCALVSIVILCYSEIYSQRSHSFVNISEGDSPKMIVQKAASVRPAPRQLEWQKLELTAFFHFGINTFTNREWGNGKEDPKLFNPESLDCRQWVKTAKDAGFKLVILTAKHHDGFCLWPSKFTSHTVASSRWKNGKGDVMRELAEACKEYGVKLGVYLSPWDMNSPLYGTDEYNDLFVNQLTELLTDYGTIDEVWFDGANGEGPNGNKQVYDFGRWYKHIRKLQPQAVIAIMGPDVRWVGTETGYGRDTEWSVVPVSNLGQTEIANNSQQQVAFKPEGDMVGEDLGSRDKIRNAKGLAWYPAEVDVSIRPGWFFHESENDKVKSPEKLLDIYFHSVGKNAVLLMNIPPDPRGLIHEKDIQALQAWKRLRDETFSVNCATGASVKFSSGNGKSLSVLDNDFDTYWIGTKQDTTAIIELTMNGEKTFNVLRLSEHIAIGQRVEKFRLDSWKNGNWVKMASGTTIGYKRLLRFDPVTAKRVRLIIESSRLNPTISEIGLYKAELN